MLWSVGAGRSGRTPSRRRRRGRRGDRPQPRRPCGMRFSRASRAAPRALLACLSRNPVVDIPRLRPGRRRNPAPPSGSAAASAVRAAGRREARREDRARLPCSRSRGFGRTPSLLRTFLPIGARPGRRGAARRRGRAGESGGDPAHAFILPLAAEVSQRRRAAMEDVHGEAAATARIGHQERAWQGGSCGGGPRRAGLRGRGDASATAVPATREKTPRFRALRSRRRRGEECGGGRTRTAGPGSGAGDPRGRRCRSLISTTRAWGRRRASRIDGRGRGRRRYWCLARTTRSTGSSAELARRRAVDSPTR